MAVFAEIFLFDVWLGSECASGICEVAPELFHDGGRYHIETSPLICSANQWTDFYMLTTSVMKELNQFVSFSFGQLQFKISNCTLKLLIIFLGIFIIDFQQAVV